MRVSLKKNRKVRREGKMRIAVTYEDGMVFQHFGHTQQFKIFDVENGEIQKEQVVDTQGNGHGALTGFLTEQGVDTLLCGGIGGGAQNALALAGIQLYGGIFGEADEVVRAFLAGRLSYNPEVHCNHHEQSCGEHSCDSKEHNCGGHGHRGE